MEKYIKNKTISIIIVLLLFLVIIFLIIYYTIPIIISEIEELLYLIKPFLNNINDKYSFIKDLVLLNINKLSFNLSNNTLTIFKNSINFITSTIIIIILSVYFLFKIDNIKHKIKELLSINTKVFTTLKNINNSLNKYLKSLFLIILIETVEYTLIYYIIGHPNYILLGLLAGFTTIIPFFGALFTNLVALITAISISSKLFIICSLIIIVLPIIDNYVIDPKIYHKTIKINPIKTIISIIISSTLFGVLGIVLAIPLCLIFDEVIKLLKKE